MFLSLSLFSGLIFIYIYISIYRKGDRLKRCSALKNLILFEIYFFSEVDRIYNNSKEIHILTTTFFL